MSFRAEWLRSRRELLAEVKAEVQKRLGREGPEIATYIRRYNAEFARPWTPSSTEVLKRKLLTSKVVLGADFHAFAQSQRIHLRLLREIPQERRWVLALEAFASEDQIWLDRLLSGEINVPEFLKRISWDATWGFPWVQYEPLIELAKRRGVQVIGINSKRRRASRMSLSDRDAHAAQVIASFRRQHPETLVYVVVGDLHLAAKNLPLAVLKMCPDLKAADVLVLLQNSEHLYFRLAQKGREHNVEVMKSGASRFCVLSSPPWVKWQSYLMFLEQTADQDLPEEGMDFTDQVAAYVRILAKDFGIRVKLENLAVHCESDFQIWQKILGRLSAPLRRLVSHCLVHEKTFFLPEIGVGNLGRLSVNHAASLAGVYLQTQASGRRHSCHKFPRDFLGAIWLEAWSFFLSKLINHGRKAESVESLRQRLASSIGADQRSAMLMALRQRLTEIRPGGASRSKPQSMGVYLEAARILGAMMGEKMYELFRAGRIPREKWLSLIQQDIFKPGFSKVYYAFVRELNPRPEA